MKDIAYILSTCNTCQRIIKEVNWTGDIQNIKEAPVPEKVLDYMADQMGSYEAIFSRRAMKYRSLGLNEMTLTEADYKKYLNMDNTFLKRPVFIINDAVFAGNTKATVAAIKEALGHAQ